MADVFVSYARRDQQLAKQIAEQLIVAGFTAWWDSDLLPHEKFATVIEEEIRAARSVLVIWSEAAVGSQWVRGEAELGREDKKLVQLVVDDCRIPIPFNQFQAADLRDWKGDASDPQWRKVLNSVAHFTATRTPDNASAVRPYEHGQVPLSRLARQCGLRRVTIRSAGGLLLLITGTAIMWTVGHQGGRGARIAVQPFRTIGNGSSLNELAAGMSDSLQDVLTQDQLQIVSPAEEERLTSADLEGQARRLGVGLMFSGTVEASGPSLKVRMRIDDPVQRATLWAAEVSEPRVQADQLQARVSALTVGVLNCSQQGLSPDARLTDAALQAFLHACELSQTASHGSAGGAAAYAMLEAMRAAARAAPEFAGAHSMLAKHLAYLSPDMPELRGEAEREARRSLELKANDPDALVAMGLLAPQLDYFQRESWYRKALASDPAWSHANGFLGGVMSDVGRLHDALAFYQRAAAVNPLSADWPVVVPHALSNVGQFPQADREDVRFAQLWPDDPLVWYWQLFSMTAQKRWSEAINLLGSASKLSSPPPPEWLSSRRDLFEALQSGNMEARERLREKLLSPGGGVGIDAIYQLALLGFLDEAFTVASHYSPAPSDSPSILFSPELARLRGDPRFMSLAARFRLVNYWRRSGHWPDFCSEPSLGYNCAKEAAALVRS